MGKLISKFQKNLVKRNENGNINKRIDNKLKKEENW